jgi:hypothetical protein
VLQLAAQILDEPRSRSESPVSIMTEEHV